MPLEILNDLVLTVNYSDPLDFHNRIAGEGPKCSIGSKRLHLLRTTFAAAIYAGSFGFPFGRF